MAPLVDTHSHLQSDRFREDRAAVVRRARAAGVACGLVAAGSPEDWDECLRSAREAGWCAALGVHPLAAGTGKFQPETAAETLRSRVAEEASRPDSRLAAIGEIGLDGFEKGLDAALAEKFFVLQLKAARDTGLPVTIHARRAADTVAKWLRRIPVSGGVIHAFSGSAEQARVFISMGLRLGFGGAMTYEGSRRTRLLAATLPLGSLVLETDSPDMPGSARRDSGDTRTEPADAALYLRVLSELRKMPKDELAAALLENSLSSFPAMRRFMRPGTGKTP